MAGYWTWVLRVRWRSYRERTQGGRRKVIGFLIQSAALFGILYFMPWFGVLKDEARLAAAGSAAIVISGVLLLIVDILRAPKKMNDMAGARIRELHRALRLDQNAEAIKQEMLTLCQEGHVLVARKAARSEADAWKGRALDALKRHYDINFIYEFEHETYTLRPPKDDDERLEWMVSRLEQTTLSWGSKAERAQTDFAWRDKALPWIEGR
jgi:hypothetical protein